MPVEILMPALSPTMTEGTLAKWNVKEGDSVSAGDVIAEIETDKATMEVEAVDEGVVGKFLVDAGTENVPVNALIAVLKEEGESDAVVSEYIASKTPVAIVESAISSEPSEDIDTPEGVNEEDEPDIPAQPAVIPDGVVEVLMPALSPTMTEGNLAVWNVKEGDSVSAGDVIAEIETDKATMEVEAVDEGVVGKLLVDAGSNQVPVNSTIALIVSDGVDVKVVDGYKPAVAAKIGKKKSQRQTPSAPVASGVVAVNAPTKAPQPPAASVNASSSGGAVKASPVARRLAKQSGIALNSLRGSGPNGRIVKNDVEDALRFGGAVNAVQRDAGEFVQFPNNGMRKTVAKRLTESKQQVPHFYLTVDIELDKLLDMRAQLNAKAAKAVGKNEPPTYKLSVNDFVIKAVALAMFDVPEANASWYDDAIVQYSNVDVSVAVAVEGGLVTPVVRNADQKSLPQISAEMKDFAGRARKGTLKPEEYQGGGFSVSNLGMYGIKQFSAILNPPQACILAVGAGEKRAVVKENTLEIATVMTVTLSVDHRAVDGAVGATFLQHLRSYIESPATMLL